MDFFKQNQLGGRARQPAPSPWGVIPDTYNENGAAADWAARMMGTQGGQPTDVSQFFGGSANPAGASTGYSPSQYVQPVRGDVTMPARNVQQNPMTGQVNNYLSQILGRR
jgi:hypothetical protein